jgi:hypothetical protein
MVVMGSNSQATFSFCRSTGSPSVSARVSDQAGGIEASRGLCMGESGFLLRWVAVQTSRFDMKPFCLTSPCA